MYFPEDQTFTTNVESFQDHLEHVVASGGADLCEDVLYGLNIAINEFDWRSSSKIIYHALDAPPHHKFFHDGCSDYYPNGIEGRNDIVWYKNLLSEAQRKNINYFMAKVKFFLFEF